MRIMSDLILSHEGELKEGKILDRPNRFILRVKFDSSSEEVYLANPGALSTVIDSGKNVLCEFAPGEDRKTDYSAFAIEVGGIYVTVKSAFANTVFGKILEKEILPEFREYNVISREPSLPGRGRADFLLENEVDGTRSYVEVKSCTHVEEGTAKFPDRPTERGRRHVEDLTELQREGLDNYVVFVVQREDAERLKPFREVDPEFADLLNEANERGVNIRAISTRFEPPDLYLENENLPIEIAP